MRAPDSATLDALRDGCDACFGTPAVWPHIERAYREPQRFYHTLAHLAELFAHLAPYRQIPHWKAIELAVWAHDVVYATAPPDYAENEPRSARWLDAITAAHCPPGWMAEHAAAIGFAHELVIATQSHRLHDAWQADPDRHRAAALFLDADLAILAAPPERLAAYDRDIAREWGQAPDAPSQAFRDGRRRALQQLRAHAPLFLSAEFAPLTARAHANLDVLIARYAASPAAGA
ncbi:HD domain-containing protein [Burkholderia sp. Ac-20379]|uniref:HD domain-containing protein n=1 Tax=Burkholderia sp. Ac-20379 TaxID=2703900 RepID=UPI0019802F15|nr:hypothetical protein [Burkholderia sp. Ac-20379]MBN3729298.1 hypothetical protein [Burkholderia sp. Ac-20379]